jgi:hypothetical protein
VFQRDAMLELDHPLIEAPTEYLAPLLDFAIQFALKPDNLTRQILHALRHMMFVPYA